MSRDTLYQNVRGHLAYLKLTAAAEALPAELDTASKTKATRTEFLDKLLSIEVAAVEARRHAGLLRFANFPAPWRLDDRSIAGHWYAIMALRYARRAELAPPATPAARRCSPERRSRSTPG